MAGYVEEMRKITVYGQMDYLKRARSRPTLGFKKSAIATKLQECSPFVRSANDQQDDKLQSAMRKMEANEKQFREGHSKQLSTVKEFHNSVRTKSTNLNENNFSDALAPRLAIDNEETKRKADIFSRRRGSLVFPCVSDTLLSNQKRRHSFQADSSKHGRSFRKLRDAFNPRQKAKISPQPIPQPV